MRIGDTISSTINQGVTGATHTVHRIATNPSAVKKVLQIAIKIFAAVDLYYQQVNTKRGLTDAMKGTTDFIDFYGSFKNIMFWINPFSKETLDKEALLESLTVSLSASHRNAKQIKKQENVAKAVYTDVMAAQVYHSKGEVREAIIISLINKHHYSTQSAHQIAEFIIIKQKSRPITQLLSTACFTVTDLTGNLLTLKKWGILDLSHVAAQVGSKSRVFLFVFNLGVDTALGTVAAAGLILCVGDASYRLIINAMKHYQAANPTEKAEAYKQLRNAILDLLSSSADLAATAAPLLFALNPPAIIALAIIAKGTGLICILVR